MEAGVRIYVCFMCSFEAHDKDALLAHMRGREHLHDLEDFLADERPYHGEVDQPAASSKSGDLAAVIEKLKQDAVLPEDVPRVNYKIVNNPIVELRSFSLDIWDFRCNQCDFTTTEEASVMQEHIKTVHPVANEEPDLDSMTFPKLQCYLCDSYQQDQGTMTKHFKSRHPEEKFDLAMGIAKRNWQPIICPSKGCDFVSWYTWNTKVHFKNNHSKKAIAKAKPRILLPPREDEVVDKYWCYRCPLGYNAVNLLRVHFSLHHKNETLDESLVKFGKQKKYQCYNCSKSSDDPAEIEKHFREAHDSVNFLEDEVFVNSLEVSDGEDDNDDISEIGLDDSDQDFEEEDEQDQDQEYKCSKCDDVSYKTETGLKLHQRKKHADNLDEMEFECYICHKPYPNKKRFDGHFGVVHATEKFDITRLICNPNFKRRFPCYRCQMSFDLKIGLKVHFSHCHKEEELSEELVKENVGRKSERYSKAEKKFHCYICSTTFTTRTNLYRHFRNMHPDHEVDKSRMAIAKSDTKNAEPNEEESKGQLVALNCVDDQTVESIMEVDTNIEKDSIEKEKHPGRSRDFKCYLCPLAYFRLRHLIRHFISIHPDSKFDESRVGEPFAAQVFHCHQCNKEFPSIDQLQTHISQHEELNNGNHEEIKPVQEIEAKDKLFKDDKNPGEPLDKRLAKIVEANASPSSSPSSSRTSSPNRLTTKEVPCYSCSKVCDDVPHFKLHFRKKHPDLKFDQDRVQVVDKTNLLQCESCSYWTTHHNQMEKHVNEKHGELQTCSKCEFSSSNQRSFKNHMAKHKTDEVLDDTIEDVARLATLEHADIDTDHDELERIKEEIAEVNNEPVSVPEPEVNNEKHAPDDLNGKEDVAAASDSIEENVMTLRQSLDEELRDAVTCADNNIDNDKPEVKHNDKAVVADQPNGKNTTEPEEETKEPEIEFSCDQGDHKFDESRKLKFHMFKKHGLVNANVSVDECKEEGRQLPPDQLEEPTATKNDWSYFHHECYRCDRPCSFETLRRHFRTHHKEEAFDFTKGLLLKKWTRTQCYVSGCNYKSWYAFQLKNHFTSRHKDKRFSIELLKKAREKQLEVRRSVQAEHCDNTTPKQKPATPEKKQTDNKENDLAQHDLNADDDHGHGEAVADKSADITDEVAEAKVENETSKNTTDESLSLHLSEDTSYEENNDNEKLPTTTTVAEKRKADPEPEPDPEPIESVMMSKKAKIKLTKVLKCDKCDYNTFHKETFELHTKLAHAKMIKKEKKVAYKTVEESFQMFCHKCSFKTPNMPEMLQHAKVHAG